MRRMCMSPVVVPTFQLHIEVMLEPGPPEVDDGLVGYEDGLVLERKYLHDS